MIHDLRAPPKKIGQPIFTDWNVKPDLKDLLHGTHPTRSQISALLTRFYENASSEGLPSCERLAQTVSIWWPQILAGIARRVRNARSAASTA